MVKLSPLSTLFPYPSPKKHDLPSLLRFWPNIHRWRSSKVVLTPHSSLLTCRFQSELLFVPEALSLVNDFHDLFIKEASLL